MVKRNQNFERLKSSYLFPEIARRRKSFLEKNPGIKIISLGVGNTTEPITKNITKGLVNAAKALGTKEGYTGYGDEQGLPALRAKIAEVIYKGKIKAEEVFVSDGAKCDIGRWQTLFGKNVTIAVQDPAYPVYIDGSIINGVENIVYLPCLPQNNFFPDLKTIPTGALIYFCSPNNPTGAVATHKQLQELVNFAKQNRSIIIFDAAYSEYISDPNLPKSIYEIPGSREVAIEVNSFSKPIGFTGVRLGWSVVPLELKYEDGQSVHSDWNRVTTTLFNGASNIAQAGGLAALTPEGQKEMVKTIKYYMKNAKIIRTGLKKLGIKTYGGKNAPYIWAHFPGQDSWEIFEKILNEAHVVCTPGVGFGPAGESFIRFSAFGHREDIEEAVERLLKIKF